MIGHAVHGFEYLFLLPSTVNALLSRVGPRFPTALYNGTFRFSISWRLNPYFLIVSNSVHRFINAFYLLCQNIAYVSSSFLEDTPYHCILAIQGTISNGIVSNSVLSGRNVSTSFTRTYGIVNDSSIKHQKNMDLMMMNMSMFSFLFLFLAAGIFGIFDILATFSTKLFPSLVLVSRNI